MCLVVQVGETSGDKCGACIPVSLEHSQISTRCWTWDALTLMNQFEGVGRLSAIAPQNEPTSSGMRLRPRVALVCGPKATPYFPYLEGEGLFVFYCFSEGGSLVSSPIDSIVAKQNITVCIVLLVGDVAQACRCIVH